MMSLTSVGGLGEEASTLFRVRKTCLKMLRKRGYNIPSDDFNMSTEEFRVRFGENPSRESQTLLVEKADDPSDQIFVFLPQEEAVGMGPIKTYTQRMRDESVTKGIIVYKGKLTNYAKQAMQQYATQGYRLEYFRDNELLVDITEHKLVPEHIVLSPQEKNELLARYRLKPAQLPRVPMADPVARYLGLQPRQVVKIIRPSETAGRYVTYRICT